MVLLACVARAQVDETITVAGREVMVHIPNCAATAPQGTVPLVFSFHAWASTAAVQAKIDKFGQLADLTDSGLCAIVAHPQGKLKATFPFGVEGYSWNAGGCCPSSSKPGKHIDDVGFIGEVAAVLRREQPTLHPSYTFLAGVSNGGMMVSRLACAYSGAASMLDVRAVAAVSGPLVNGTADGQHDTPFACDRTDPVPVLHFHGTADPIVPYLGCNASYNGGVSPPLCRSLHLIAKFAPFPDIEAYIADWRRRNGIPGTPAGAVTFQNRSTQCVGWGVDVHRTNVTFCTIKGEGHAWPGDPQSLGGNYTTDIDASAHIWAFFAKFMPSARSIMGPRELITDGRSAKAIV